MAKKITVKSKKIKEDVKGGYYRVEVTSNFIDPVLETELETAEVWLKKTDCLRLILWITARKASTISLMWKSKS